MQPPPQATLGRLPKTAVFVVHAILYSKRPLTKCCEVSILPPLHCQIDGTWQKMIPAIWQPAFVHATLLEEMRKIHWHKTANIKRAKKSPNASLYVINGGFKDRKDVAVAEGKQRRGNSNAGGGQTVLAVCVIIVYITVCHVMPYSCSLFLLSSPLQRFFFVFFPKSWHSPSCLLWAHFAYLPSIVGLDAKRQKLHTLKSILKAYM